MDKLSEVIMDSADKTGGELAPTEVTEEALDADPHRWVATLRKLAPVWCRSYGPPSANLRLYTVFPYALAESIFTLPGTRQFENEILAARGVRDGALLTLYSNGMLASNGDVHKKRRAPLSRAFAFPVIRAMAPEIRRVVRGTLMEKGCQGRMNLPAEFARELPAKLMCGIMGIPVDDIDRFVEWVQKAAPGLSAFRPEMVGSINEATEALMEYVRGLLAYHRKNPGDNFLSRYLESVDKMPNYSEEETYVQIAGIILAGAETTRCSITIAVSLLLANPRMWEALKAKPTLAESAAKEALRFEPAVGTSPRLVTEDLSLVGVRIPAGSILSASILGALRDPEVFVAPDEFDIGRTNWPRQHLAFGGGAHRCLGEALAFTEIVESLAAFAELLPQAKLTNGPVTVSGFSGVRRIGECWIEY